ncbi:MAG: hypothetical protein QM504_06810 [Pseudomonadota bacterium]
MESLIVDCPIIGDEVLVVNHGNNGFEPFVFDLSDEMVQWHVERYESHFEYVRDDGLKAILVCRRNGDFGSDGGDLSFFASAGDWSGFSSTGQTRILFRNIGIGSRYSKEQVIEIFEAVLLAQRFKMVPLTQMELLSRPIDDGGQTSLW